MTSLQRLEASLRGVGPGATAVKIWGLVADHIFDARYGLDTCKCAQLEALTIPSENKERGRRYQPTRVLPLRKLFRLIMPMVPANSVLVDLGCGKGRVLLVAAEFGFKEVRGIEFAHELCEVAKKNCAKYKTRKRDLAECRVIEGDVTQYAIQDDEAVFFMFNPFDDVILEKVIGNIAASLKAAPRKVLIIYYNPRGAQVIEERNDFKRVQEFNFWGFNFKVYSNLA